MENLDNDIKKQIREFKDKLFENLPDYIIEDVFLIDIGIESKLPMNKYPSTYQLRGIIEQSLKKDFKIKLVRSYISTKATNGKVKNESK